ncbi:hypothetical protein DFQ05_2545 [Winogradskyella wandonensis]|uniref:Thioredoxin-like protein n=1 Tax=Winogradskyella wandonensis TaxID=1442586 RepID=A0A4R1KIZ8_9FLAO|nr:hypothetical protein [Winogradskyella wandonensis]TCK64808.1 hypothetical protein DFQ05_2545 [Winogradskyella wandonensis]
MKYYSLSVIFCCVTLLGFSQKIKWENNYAKALELTRNTDKMLLIYFVNGVDKEAERKINQDIFKSDELKSLANDFIIYKIDTNTNSRDSRYNERLISSYNYNRVFPAIKVAVVPSYNAPELFTKFDDAGIKLFFKTLKNLK